MPDTKIEIRCKKTRRLLTKIDSSGLHLFCRQDKEEHVLTVDDLLKILADVKQGTNETTYTI